MYSTLNNLLIKHFHPTYWVEIIIGRLLFSIITIPISQLCMIIYTSTFHCDFLIFAVQVYNYTLIYYYTTPFLIQYDITTKKKSVFGPTYDPDPAPTVGGAAPNKLSTSSFSEIRVADLVQHVPTPLTSTVNTFASPGKIYIQPLWMPTLEPIQLTHHLTQR